jgi:hypothetical protein
MASKRNEEQQPPRPRSVGTKKAKRSRTARPYPASSFSDALALGQAIMKHGAGQKIRRLTLLEKMDRAPNSGPTKMMITNSGKYGITKGSYAAEHLELTPAGKLVVDSNATPVEQRKASFDLAVAGIAPFKTLYDQYKGNRLPAKEVMKDALKDGGITVPDPDECVDTFVVNAKQLDLLRAIGGAETLVPIEQVLDELPRTGNPWVSNAGLGKDSIAGTPKVVETAASVDFSKTCFYITPIGDEGSEARKHADLFMGSIIEPALDELGLKVVRADKIGNPGMITSQVLEYLRKSRLAIADLSYLNPNVFYEVALRHARRLPTVQIIRKCDHLPFDINQVRSLIIDTSDIYTLVPRIPTYRSELAMLARKAIEDPESVGNPISVFFPAFFAQ